jgi:hypothetical protein
LQEGLDPLLRLFELLQGEVISSFSSRIVSWPQAVFSSNSMPIRVMMSV